MRLDIEVLIWLIANVLTVAVVGHDFWDTLRIWQWARRNGTPADKAISFRSFRLSTARLAVALSFLSAGILAAVQVTSVIVWLLIFGAAVLAYDAMAEFQYRKNMFRRGRDLSAAAKLERDNHKNGRH